MRVLTSIGVEARELWGGGKGRPLVVIAIGWRILLGTRMAYPVLLPYLRTSFDLSLTVAGLLVTVLWLGSALGQFPGGVLADRYSERLVMVAGAGMVSLALVLVLVGPVVGFVLLPFVEGFWSLAAVTALVSTIFGSGAVTQSFLCDTIPANIRGTGLGGVRTSAATLGAMGPVVFGAIADRGYFDEGYLLLGVIGVVVILLTLRLPDPSRS